MIKVNVIRPLLKGKAVNTLINGTNHPGTYRWWFHENALKALGLSNNYSSTLLSELIDGQMYYALYFGIAVNETIRMRLDWHINQKHTISNMRSGGTLSTLRSTLGALLFDSIKKSDISITCSENVINTFMDDYCIVEWMPYNGNNKKEDIELMESNELQKNYWYPLNLDKNVSGRSINPSYLQSLSTKRKVFSDFFGGLGALLQYVK